MPASPQPSLSPSSSASSSAKPPATTQAAKPPLSPTHPDPIAHSHGHSFPMISPSPLTAFANGGRQRRESRPITAIETTTTAVPIPNSLRSTGRRDPSVAVAGCLGSSPLATRTENTTFSLPIEMIDTPDLDELCLSPVVSAPSSRPTTPLSLTPVLAPSPLPPFFPPLPTKIVFGRVP